MHAWKVCVFEGLSRPLMKVISANNIPTFRRIMCDIVSLNYLSFGFQICVS